MNLSMSLTSLLNHSVSVNSSSSMEHTMLKLPKKLVGTLSLLISRISMSLNAEVLTHLTSQTPTLKLGLLTMEDMVRITSAS